jgi:hypothetical protein
MIREKAYIHRLCSQVSRQLNGRFATRNRQIAESRVPVGIYIGVQMTLVQRQLSYPDGLVSPAEASPPVAIGLQVQGRLIPRFSPDRAYRL